MSGAPRLRFLKRDECTRLLAQATLGRVSVTMSALPVIRTVRYALTAEHVVFRVASNSRLRAAAASSVIAFHADRGGETDGIGWSVLVQGICQEVTSPELTKHLQALPLPPWSSDDAFLRLPLTHVSGELVYWCEPEAPRSRSPLC